LPPRVKNDKKSTNQPDMFDYGHEN
jgi:hypothetical protein